jgi:anti-sigma factor RsiW
MSCPEFDLKGYVLKELPRAEARATELHAAGCNACREELERLSLTFTALRAVPEEEMPRRIAFVSDKVFEPKWWQAWLNSGPRMAFVSSLVLAAAILAHGVIRPVEVAGPAPALDTAVIEARVNREVALRLDHAVKQAVTESEARQAEKIRTVVAAAEKRFEFERQADRVQVEEAFNVVRKQMTRWYMASAELGGAR